MKIHKKGFTLIELLVVIFMIMFLLLAAIGFFSSHRTNLTGKTFLEQDVTDTFEYNE